MTQTKGSEWRKWDLHFHTPSSYDYANKSVTNQQLIDGLQAHEISVVAITDHHVIDVLRIQELQKLGHEKGITVLPGIEFLAELRGSEPIHFIAIFPENSNLNFVWKQLESKTNISRMEGERKKANEVYCDLLDTAKLVKELGGLVTIHAGKKSNGIENIPHSLPYLQELKTDVAQAVDIFEVGKETDCIDYVKHVIPFLKEKLKRHIPIIICSDNHQIDSYLIRQNLWIKADKNFEGLKQIIFEPEHRVRIQKEKPDFKEDRLIIDQVKFKSSANLFTSDAIHFNENLNVIIGGKSSGKSILLYHIAKTLLADQGFLKKENLENKYDFRNLDTKFDFEILTKGGFKQQLYRATTENSVIPEIKYIPQNYLIKLAEPEENKKGNALNKIVRDLINEDQQSQQLYEDFISKVKANDRKRESIVDNYFEIKERINQLAVQLQGKPNKDILTKNIQTNTAKVEELNKSTGMTSEQLINYNKLQLELEENTLAKTRANNDYRKITEFNAEAINQLNTLQNKKQLLSASLENTNLKQHFDDSYSFIEEAIKKITEITAQYELTKEADGTRKFKLTSAASSEFDKITEEQIKIEQGLIPYLRTEEVKVQVDSILKSINDDKASLQSIHQLSKEIADNEAALIFEKESLFNLIQENYRAYLDIISALKPRTIDLEKDGLKIEGLTAFNFPKFQKAILGFSDGRSASYSPYKICDYKLDALSSLPMTEILSDLKSMFEAIVEKGNYVLIGKTQKKIAVKALLDDYFFDYWQIMYKGDKLDKMSTGKASFVILMLIVGLSKSKAPILIDQPEDNLDNRSITSDLVEYLKNKKLERQIILVTHNANIVVNADAENVIIAHQKGQGDVETLSPYQFDYINGPLENSFQVISGEKNLLKSMGVREHVADILEGGKAAFQKREEKYGFQKIS